jgi:hypothetical protein
MEANAVKFPQSVLSKLRQVRPALVYGLLLCLSVGAAPLAAQTTDLSGPGFQVPVIVPISPAEADARDRARTDLGGQNVGLRLPQDAPSKQGANGATLKSGFSAASAGAVAAPIPASVAELARALKYDPVLIYEFVRNNIEYVPIAAALKGSEGTLSDGAGTAYDIAQLTIELINADPNQGATASAVKGVIEMTPADAASWLALNGMNVCSLQLVFSAGGVATAFNPSTTICSSVSKIQISHVWVKVKIGSNTYEIDPSYKLHLATPPTVNLATATGYIRSQYLANACSGCNVDPKNKSNLYS